jgi:hypothetical protein
MEASQSLWLQVEMQLEYFIAANTDLNYLSEQERQERQNI